MVIITSKKLHLVFLFFITWCVPGFGQIAPRIVDTGLLSGNNETPSTPGCAPGMALRQMEDGGRICVPFSSSPCGEGETYVDLGGKDGGYCTSKDSTNDFEDCSRYEPFSLEEEACTNRVAAQNAANANAEQRIVAALDEAIAEATAQCEAAAAQVFDNCSSIEASPQGGSISGGSSSSQCSGVVSNSNAAIAENQRRLSDISQCQGLRSSVASSCPNSTGLINVQGSATVGGQSATATRQGSRQIGENVQTLERAESVIAALSPKEEEFNTANTELNRIISECNAHIDNQAVDDYVAGGDGNGYSGDTDGDYDTTGADTTSAPTTDSGSGEMSNSKSGGNMWGNLLGAAAGIAAGSMGAGETEVPQPSDDGYNYKPYAYDNSTLGGGSDGGGLGGGGAAYDQNGTSFNKRPDDFIPTKDATGPENPDGGGANATLAGGPRAGGGAGDGFAGMPPGGNGQRAANGRSGRRNGSAKARQMISGHKRTKQNADGSGRSGLRGKLSPGAMKLAYEKAIKKFGRKVPLKFDGSKYVPDLLAMKNSRNFKMRNARTVAMYQGTKAQREMTLDEKLLEKQINPNAKHGIFRTMNIYFRRNFENASQANGLKL